VVSTINGDSNVPFYKELGNQGLKANDVPVVAFSVGRRGTAPAVDTKPLVGHPPPGTTHVAENPVNDAWKPNGRLRKKMKLANASKPLTNDPMEGRGSASIWWKQAAEKAKTTDVDKVIAAMAGQLQAPSGITRPWTRRTPSAQGGGSIGEVRPTASSNVVWKTPGR